MHGIGLILPGIGSLIDVIRMISFVLEPFSFSIFENQ